jgi:hypothetical protein
MRIGAVIEIALDEAGALPEELITEAYRASRAAAIAFVLDPLVWRPAVDRILDPVVAENCGNVHGVLYLDESDDQTIAAAISRAEFVVAMTDEFRARCESRGVSSVAWPAARSMFSGLSDRRRAFIPSFRTGPELQPVAT